MRTLIHIKKQDPEVYKALKAEIKRQKEGIELVPSENIVSGAVLEALGSVLTNKYSEGYPRKRYYPGQENIDCIEEIAIERAKKIFKVPHANVQPYSGSPANLAVYLAVCQPGDVIMGMNLPDGGHLTHGWSASATSIFFKSVPYHVKPDSYIDFEEVEKLALKHRPKLIWVGATAYAHEFPFEKFAKIADKVGAYLAADIAHIAGLVIAGVHKSPVEFAHIVSTTTHKTLRGPRGGMILVTHKGLRKDPELAKKIDCAVFPGLQGGPHDHQVAATAVALGEAMKPAFRKYGQQIVKNAKALAKALMKRGFKLVGGGTENHLMIIDCGKGRGIFLHEALERVGITANKNTIPKDPSTPFYPSGLRLGTPAVTTRGMKEKDMEKIAEFLARVAKEIEKYNLPAEKKEIGKYLAGFRREINRNVNLKRIRKEVRRFCKQFPLPGM